MKSILPYIVTLLFLQCGCQNKPTAHSRPTPFTVPPVPAMFTTLESRAAFLSSHYWDNFNFSDTTLIANPEVTEQAFVNFLQVIAAADAPSREKGVGILLTRAMSGDSLMFAHFVGLAERYLYEPNSPMRNEELYIPFLKQIIENPHVDDLLKTRPRYQWEMAMKNRPGDGAADFVFSLKNETKSSLHQLKSDYTVLFFNNPDCTDCKRIKELLTTTPLFAKNPRLKIVAIYPDEEVDLWQATDYPAAWVSGRCREVATRQLYDLRAIPTLYLLDKDKRVILKDAPIEAIAKWISNN